MPSEQVADAARNSRPLQFTLAKLLRFMVGLGIVLAVARGFGLLAGAALAATTAIIWLLPWPQLPKRLPYRLLLVAGMGLGTWLLGPFSAIVVTVIVGFLLARFRLGLLALYIALAPFGANYVHGIIDYWRGEARLRTFGYFLCPECANLDPRWRCQCETRAGVAESNSWMYHDPYNFAVQSMIRLFGYMPGTYTGPYPSFEHAYTIVGQGADVSVTDLQHDRVLLSNEECVLSAGIGKEIVDHAQQRFFLGSPPTRPISTQAILWREECLIIGLSPADSPKFGRFGAFGIIVLISRHSGKPFAWYLMRNY